MRFIRFGVTVAEVLVAVVVLTVGVLALVGTWARTSRMIGLGRHSTVAALAASSRIEWLRQAALASTPPCSGPGWRNGAAAGAWTSERWDILDTAGAARRVRVVVSHRTPAGPIADTVVSAVWCEPR